MYSEVFIMLLLISPCNHLLTSLITDFSKNYLKYADLSTVLCSLDSCCSVQFRRAVISNYLRPHGLQHARLPSPSPTPRAYSNSCPSSWWCHPTISSSVVPFSSCLQFFQASGSFKMSHFFESGGQSIGVSASASVLPMNIQDCFPLG